MSVIDDYFKNVAAPERAELQRVRDIVKLTAPEAEEVITYGMPGFKYKKKYLVAFAAFKDHLSIFPGSTPIGELSEKLKDFKQSKGTIQFTLNHSLPDELIQQLVKLRIKEIETK